MKTKLLLILIITVLISCSRKTNEEAESFFNSGKSKAELKDYKVAIADFTKAIELDSTYAAAYYYRGDARELMPMAEADSAVAVNPKSAEAYFKRGNARAYLQVAVEQLPGDPNETNYVISEYVELNREAIKDFRKAAELDSTFEEAYNKREIGEANRPDYKVAIEDYTKAIELDPKYADAYKCRGYSKYELQDYRGAIEDYNEAKDLNFGFSSGLSIDDYDNAIKLDPKFAGAYFGRGNITGEEDFKKAIELDPKYTVYYNRLKEGAAAEERAEEDFLASDQAAKEQYFLEEELYQSKELERSNEEIKDDSTNAKAYNRRGLAKVNLQDYWGAIEDFNKAIELDPKVDYFFSNRESAIESIDASKYAEAYYTEAIKLNPKSAEAYYTKAIELNPKSAEAYCGRGFVKSYLETADYQGAVEDYDKAIELDPQFEIAYYHRGLAKYELQDYRGAIEDYTKAIGIKPKHADAYIQRGSAKYDVQDYKGAIEDFNKAIAVNTTYATYAYYLIGLAKYELKDYRGAIEDFSKAIEGYSQYAEAYYGRGIAKTSSGQKDSGCMDLRKAGELGYKYASEKIKEYCN